MQFYKNSKLLAAVSLFITISMVFFLFSMTGCLGRVARARALAKTLAEDTESEEEQEDVPEEEEKESTSASSEAQSDSGDEVTPDSSSADDSVSEEETPDQDSQNDNGSAGDDENIENEVEEDEDIEDEDEDESEESQQYTADMPHVEAEGGNIWEDEAFDDSSLIIGDTGGDELQSRAYVSFDISELSGAQITDALISANANDIKGKPFETYGPVIIKAVYWGPNPLNSSMFELDGVELANFSSKNFGIGNATLKNDLQNAANSASGRYQIMLYFEIGETDGDGEPDYVLYDIGANAITLNVSYTK